jgi:threonylcarbamoyladenosine tRNA methylthiotransferase MtaB
VKFFIRTFGCKMNLLDSARVAAALCDTGHEQVASEAEADVVLVNSCTVTAESDRKSRRAAHAAQREGKRVAVLGCGPRVDLEAWKRSVAGVEVYASEQALCGSFGAAQGDRCVHQRTRLPVAIQHGCDNTCAYCITRVARGPHRSVPQDEVLRLVREVTLRGGHEVVLTGINLAAWGCSLTTRPSESGLALLLKAILRETSIGRVRLSSLGPEYLDLRFFAAFADERICDHLHLSVQSGSLSVLRRMGRGHGVAEVEQAACWARQARPDVALTADFIVGFPGESEDDFRQTLQLAERVGFAHLHVFPFSPREGTVAATLPDKIPDVEKKRRAARLSALGRALREQFLRSQHGRRGQALMLRDGTAITSNYLRLRGARGERGSLVDVVIDVRDVVGQ